MTKQELIVKIADNHDDLSKKKVEQVVGDVFNTISGSLQEGEKISWPKFGTFQVTERAARKGRNPRTGETIDIAASKGVKFKVSSSLKDVL
ncbi:MAG: DNA-binding protein [Candidatus Altiarchaeales archaeon]|nr:DNA-binding protein [Candidatus Altiarchaeales archaeon]